MEQYTVTGMSCAACASRVEKAVSRVPGVDSCSVSLLTNSMGVEGSASPQDIIEAVEEAGYGAAVKGAAEEAGGAARSMAADEDALKDRETPVLKRRLIASVGFLIILMYFSMGHMMWGWPVPAFFAENHVAMGILQLLLTTIVMVINQKFFHKRIERADPQGSQYGHSGGARVRRFLCMERLRAVCHDRCPDEGRYGRGYDLYARILFESAAMILALITVGKMLEARSKGKTTDALKSLMKLAPKTAVIMKKRR